MRTILAVLVMLIVSVGNAFAAIPEARMFAGAYVPTGKQADALKSSMLLGVQGAVELTNNMHLVGTLGYATPRPDQPTIGKDVHLYQYDIGAELFRVYGAKDVDRHWTLRPFVGLGAGGRTYDFKGITAKAQTHFLGYGALGTELQHLGIAARIEARDYVSRFQGLAGELKATTRNDLVLAGGLAYHF